MQSLKAKILSAFACSATVFSAALPGRDVAFPRPEGKLLQLDLQQNYAHATFSVPCTGCLGHSDTDQDDESLILSFTSHAQDEACGSSNITLNGVYLPQEWNGDFASGSGSYSGVTDLEQNEWFLQRDLDLEWKSACLHGQEETDESAQVLTVNIKAIDGKPLDTPSGFTISFKQQSKPPVLLRLEQTPNPSASDKAASESWRSPPQYLRLVVSNTTEGLEVNDDSPSLEDDIRELKALQAEVEELHKAIAEKKKYIQSQLRKEAQSFTEELNQCKGLACILKTIGHKAHGAWRLVYVHFTPSHYRHHTHDMGRPEEVFAQAHAHTTQLHGGHLKADTSIPRPYEAPNNELPPRPPKAAPYIVALEVTLGILCCGCLFAVIRHKCSSLRTRAERAAAAEERTNARAYRRAARQHAWRNWWRGNWARRDQERIADYEEKRALIQEQEGVLEDAMQEEIRQLRAAHDVVNDLVRDAEEGRVINYAPCHCHHQARAPCSPMSVASTYPPTSLPEVPSRPLSRTDSLPSYRSGAPSEPPNYDSDMDMSEVVANGFRQYTSSTTSDTSSHWTPDSSVVDVSPRPSAETLRYPRSILTCDEESDID